MYVCFIHRPIQFICYPRGVLGPGYPKLFLILYGLLVAFIGVIPKDLLIANAHFKNNPDSKSMGVEWGITSI